MSSAAGVGIERAGDAANARKRDRHLRRRRDRRLGIDEHCVRTHQSHQAQALRRVHEIDGHQAGRPHRPDSSRRRSSGRPESARRAASRNTLELPVTRTATIAPPSSYTTCAEFPVPPLSASGSGTVTSSPPGFVRSTKAMSLSRSTIKSRRAATPGIVNCAGKSQAVRVLSRLRRVLNVTASSPVLLRSTNKSSFSFTTKPEPPYTTAHSFCWSSASWSSGSLSV